MGEDIAVGRLVGDLDSLADCAVGDGVEADFISHAK